MNTDKNLKKKNAIPKLEFPMNLKSKNTRDSFTV